MIRKFLLVAAAGAIALVGLSANQCTGEKKPAEQAEPAPATPPAEPAPAAPPADTMAPAEPPAGQ